MDLAINPKQLDRFRDRFTVSGATRHLRFESRHYLAGMWVFGGSGSRRKLAIH